MLATFQAEGIRLPVIFYVGEPKPDAGTPRAVQRSSLRWYCDD